MNKATDDQFEFSRRRDKDRFNDPATAGVFARVLCCLHHPGDKDDDDSRARLLDACKE
jgi:hypothetical protein